MIFWRQGNWGRGRASDFPGDRMALSGSRCHLIFQKNSRKSSCPFYKLAFMALRLVFCMQWVLPLVLFVCCFRILSKDENDPSMNNTYNVTIFSCCTIEQLQNNWKKENKSRRRTLMKCPSILAISLDLQNYLLRAHQCRYSIYVVVQLSYCWTWRQKNYLDVTK